MSRDVKASVDSTLLKVRWARAFDTVLDGQREAHACSSVLTHPMPQQIAEITAIVEDYKGEPGLLPQKLCGAGALTLLSPRTRRPG